MQKIKLWICKHILLPKFIRNWYIKRLEKQITNKLIDYYVSEINKSITSLENIQLKKENKNYVFAPYLPITNNTIIGNQCWNPDTSKIHVSSKYWIINENKEETIY